MSYIAMNRFRVAKGREEDFEEIWRKREGRLSDMQGFVEFRMLKGPGAEDHTLYASHTIWASEADFRAWTKSEAFRAAHKNAGSSGREGIFMGPPNFEGFSTQLHEA